MSGFFRYSDWLSRNCTIQNYGTYVRTLPSYIKDSQHALEIFRNFNFLGQNKLTFAMDIISLHTFIPNGCIKRCNSQTMIFFNQRTVKEASSEKLLRLAELVLTPNCFSFDGNDYKLTNGVAMGTKMGPSYANVFVGFIEHQFFLVNTTAPKLNSMGR